MRYACMFISMWAFLSLGCGDDASAVSGGADAGMTDREGDAVAYTDWSEDMTGTTAKPAYGRCRYRAVDSEVWSWPVDGDNDRLTLTGAASGEVALSLYALDGASSVMLANVSLQRVLSGKAYYEAVGDVQFGEALSDTWTVVDGTVCFETSLVNATGDVPGEFSLIAEQSGALRTIGGTFTLAADAINGSDALNINDQAIGLDIR